MADPQQSKLTLCFDVFILKPKQKQKSSTKNIFVYYRDNQNKKKYQNLRENQNIKSRKLGVLTKVTTNRLKRAYRRGGLWVKHEKFKCFASRKISLDGRSRAYTRNYNYQIGRDRKNPPRNPESRIHHPSEPNQTNCKSFENVNNRASKRARSI